MKHHNPYKIKSRKNSGYSLGELLIVVGIVVILLAVAVPAVFLIQRNLRQKELDSKAEIIYVAVQNKLSRMKAAGSAALVQEGSDTCVYALQGEYPDDCDPEADNIEAGAICCFTSSDLSTAGSAAAAVMDGDTIDASLLGNHWVVEYNPNSCIVYAVFYSENRENCAQNYVSSYETYDTRYRYRDKRLSAGANVGYYGGGSAASGSQVQNLSPTLEVVNAEKLTAEVKCTVASGTEDQPVFKVVIEDTAGNVYTAYYAYGGISDEYQTRIKNEVGDSALLFIGKNDQGEEIEKTGRTYTLDLTLDDLSTDDTRFYNLYGKGASFTETDKLESGTPIKITVTALCPGNKEVSGTLSDSKITNSLFADENSSGSNSDGLNEDYGSGRSPAVISCGRHLQNLDTSSGLVQIPFTTTDGSLKNPVQYAAQGADIDFSADSDWYADYSKAYFNGSCEDDTTPNFKPITNSALKEYSGELSDTSYTIAHLSAYTTAANADAGLFETLSGGQRVVNVTMTGTSVIAEGDNTSAGAIAGTVSGNASIENCQVYLATADTKGKSNQDIWISGTAAGGLVGAAESGNLIIKNSSASTVIGSYPDSAAERDAQGNITAISAFTTENAGGLIGQVAGSASVSVTASYADNYLAGTNAGGLIGTSEGTAVLDSCYAAGFMSYRNGAGLVYGKAGMKNSYTIMYGLYRVSDAVYLSTAADGSTVSGNVYYFASGTEAAGDVSGTTSISSAAGMSVTQAFGSDTVFTSDTAGSTFYNLMGQAITSYDYPVIKNLHHYGDWNAAFMSGSLVYYEKYSDGTYGFYGANADSTLKDTADITVVGDGYGIVYLSTDTRSESLTFSIDGTSYSQTVDTSSSGTHYNVTSGSTTYYIYPLSADICNLTKPSSDFYLKAKVQMDVTGAEPSYYYFNPHFAKTVVKMSTADDSIPTLNSDSRIYVRTARHLYMMSLYYDTYAAKTASCTYLQERNIDYTKYGWADYSTRADKNSNPTSQSPIAAGNTAFQAVYDGQCYWITDVSFVSDAGTYVGFIGNNNGTIRNVVLTSEYTEGSSSNYNVRRTGVLSANSTAYLGVLVGLNGSSGRISNCAVAGYYISGADGTLFAYNNAALKAGGLVGENRGTITNCEADTPTMRLSSNYARTCLGGFVGSNQGTITNSYALGNVEVVFSKGGSVSIAGFAADNQGIINNSYCAAALTSTGDTCVSYGFAPAGGSVSGCRYLNNGTYSYIGHMHPFSFDKGVGESLSYNELKAEASGSAAVYCYNFSNTETGDSKYPFTAVVTNAAGQKVHYGDWIDDEVMGAFGIFYWEKEEGGTNNGYHFTYLGSDNDTVTGDTSLCNSHDDGGVITEYGYGFYEKNEGSVTLTMDGSAINGSISVSSTQIISGSVNYNKQASDALNAQIHYTYTDSNGESKYGNYYFYAFTTQTAADAGAGEDYLCMTSTTAANCTWTLTYQLSGSSASEKSVVYTLCPFFANAMQISSGSYTITGNDGNKTDYSMTPGLSDNSTAAGNPYEIRSIQQLQFINWRYDQLSYTDTSSEGTEPYFLYECAKDKYYVQSHDVKNTTESDGTSTKFYPLGRAGRSFKEHYNGNSYQIKNLWIEESTSSYVGLFGELGGEARLSNMILTAEPGKGRILSTYYANSTNNSSNNYREPAVGAYAGLIWTKYGSSNVVMQNCTASGYEIVYDGTVVSGFYRYISMGGLVASAFGGAIKNCSASNTIEVTGTTNGIRQHLGGLVGSAGNANGGSYACTITNCYSGGKITTVNTTNVLCGGLVGNAQANDRNTGNSTYSSSISNCYSFCEIISSTVSGITGYHYIYGNSASCNNSYFMKRSNADANTTIQNNNGLTYEQMSDGTLLRYLDGDYSQTGSVSSLDAGYHNVTTAEGQAGIIIDGKYSYPSNSTLEGKNYPFPEIIEQKDLVFSTSASPVYVYVHYGDWPIDGPYWENGIDSMDIFADMQDNTYAEKTFKLYLNGKTDITEDKITSADTSIAVVTAVGAQASDSEGTYIPVTVRAISTGTAAIQVSGYDISSMTMEVTADITLTADPQSMVLANEKSSQTTLHALDADDGTDYAADSSTAWTAETAESDDADRLTITAKKNVLTVVREDTGTCQIKAAFSYDYHGVTITKEEYIAVLQAVTVTLSAPGSTKETQTVYAAFDSAEINQGSYTTPEKDDLYFAGWVIPNTNTVVISDTDGTLSPVKDVSGYTDSSGNWICDTACTLQAKWITGYTVTLMNGNTAVSTEVITTDSTASGFVLSDVSVTAPETGYTLQGWYTAQSLTEGTKVLNADGSICAAVDGYTAKTDEGNYKFDLSQSQTLYACWMRATDKYYLTNQLIVGEEYLFCSSDSNSGAVFKAGNKNTTVTIQTDSVSGGKYIDGSSLSEAQKYTIYAGGIPGYTDSDGKTYYFWIKDDGSEGYTGHYYRHSQTVTDISKATPMVYDADANVLKTINQDPSGDYGYFFYYRSGFTAYCDSVSNSIRTTIGHTYIYQRKYEYSFNNDDAAAEAASPQTDGVNSDDVTPISAEPVQYSLLLQNASNEYWQGMIENGGYAVPDYTAPTRTGSAWTLDGWYTAEDGTGTKVLNADGTVVSETVDGYTADGALALAADTTLYARWSRLTNAYVLTDELEPGGNYIIAAVPDTDDDAQLLALGQVSADTDAYTQYIRATDPTETAVEYSLYDEETGETAPITQPFITDVTQNLVWYCLDEDDNDTNNIGALYNSAGYMVLDDTARGYSFTWDINESTAGWQYDTDTGALLTQIDSEKTVSLSFCKDEDTDTMYFACGDTVYSALQLYKRTAVQQVSFGDETMALTLSYDTAGETFAVKVSDGSWPDWGGCVTPTRDGYRFLGWYDSAADDAEQVLDEDGLFAADNVDGYIQDGRWIGGSNVTLFAHWEQLPQDEEESAEATEEEAAPDETADQPEPAEVTPESQPETVPEETAPETEQPAETPEQEQEEPAPAETEETPAESSEQQDTDAGEETA